jgi:hypothetical protein
MRLGGMNLFTSMGNEISLNFTSSGFKVFSAVKKEKLRGKRLVFMKLLAWCCINTQLSLDNNKLRPELEEYGPLHTRARPKCGGS